MLLLLALACKDAAPPDTAAPACTLFCADLNGDGRGELTRWRCKPVCRLEPPPRPACAYTDNCPR